MSRVDALIPVLRVPEFRWSYDPELSKNISPAVLSMHSTSKTIVLVGKRVISSSDRLYKQDVQKRRCTLVVFHK